MTPAPVPSDAHPSGFRVVPLGPDTWEAFADLVERNNGVHGGRWQTAASPACARWPGTPGS